MSRPLCIYHGNCADGFTAAWVVRQALGGAVDFHAGLYGQPPPDVAGRDVIMVDFSYSRAVLEQLLHSGDVRQANTFLILDHHKTAKADLVGIPTPEEDDGFASFNPDLWRGKWEQNLDWPVRSVFDMTRSGAQVAWDFFFPGSNRPLLVDYTGDRDLWRFDLPMSREVNAFIFAHAYSFKTWDSLDSQLPSKDYIAPAAVKGAAIELKQHKDVAELVALLKRRMVIGGMNVPVANLPHTLCSDAGHLMAQGEPFAACYWDTPDFRVFSLRSADGGIDVSAIARRYGGGGHHGAAGFQMPLGWEGDGPHQVQP